MTKQKTQASYVDTIINCDTAEALSRIPEGSVDCIVTSPPYYGLRNYGAYGQIGLEETFDEYLDRLLEVTNELFRVLKPSGTLWWNHGDSYAGAASGISGKSSQLNGWKRTQNASAKMATAKRRRGGDFHAKSLTMQSYRLAMRMIDEQGWILRNQIIWHKPNVMPSSARDRFTVDFESVFFFVKNEKYYFERQYEPLSPVSIARSKYAFRSRKANLSGEKSPGIDVERMGERFVNPRGRNKRSVWNIPTSGSKEAHVAMFPEKLISPMIQAGCPEGGVVLDPFIGSGTTAVAAIRLGRHYIGIDINPEYVRMAKKRVNGIRRNDVAI